MLEVGKKYKTMDGAIEVEIVHQFQPSENGDQIEFVGVCESCATFSQEQKDISKLAKELSGFTIHGSYCYRANGFCYKDNRMSLDLLTAH